MTVKYKVVESFLERYQREYDFYQILARLVADRCEALLEAHGIRSQITSRAKRPDKLRVKVEHRNKKAPYASTDSIIADIADLAGVRIAAYFPGDFDKVDQLMHGAFEVHETKTFPPSTAPVASATPDYDKRFAGYRARHFRASMKSDALPADKVRYANVRVDIQLASVLMHAWAEVEHDLIYKPEAGMLDISEHAALDSLNGLVMSGELILENLQRAIAARALLNSNFSNHYEVAPFVASEFAKKGVDPSTASMGRVDILFRLLQLRGTASPTYLRDIIERMGLPPDGTPLTELIIDQLIADDPDAARLHRQALQEAGRNPYSASREPIPSQLPRVAEILLSRWRAFENAVRKALGRPKGALPSTRELFRLQLLSEDSISEFEQARTLRNRLVHDTKALDPLEIYWAATTIGRIIQRGADSKDKTTQEAFKEATQLGGGEQDYDLWLAAVVESLKRLPGTFIEEDPSTKAFADRAVSEQWLVRHPVLPNSLGLGPKATP